MKTKIAKGEKVMFKKLIPTQKSKQKSKGSGLEL